MIELNLLPEDLQVKSRKIGVKSIPPVYIIYGLIAVLCFLVLLHIVYGGIGLYQGLRLNNLNSKWAALEPDRASLQDYKSQLEAFSADAKAMQKLIKQRISWAQKLNRLSLDLPKGIWFNELTVNQKELTVKCSAISPLQKEEYALINKFIDGLKADSLFVSDFSDIKLASAQKRTIGSYGVVDFIIIGAIKNKNEPVGKVQARKPR